MKKYQKRGEKERGKNYQQSDKNVLNIHSLVTKRERFRHP